MRDLAFDIVARDRTQATFEAISRRTHSLGDDMDRTAASTARATADMSRLAAATDRATASTRLLTAANNNWQRRNLMMQLGDVGQTLALGASPFQVLLQQGPQIAQIYGPGEGGIGRAFRETGSIIGGVLTKFPLLTAAAAVAAVGFAGLTVEINRASEASVTMGDVAGAAFTLVADAVRDQLAPVLAAIAPWVTAAWDKIVQATKTVGNLIIGGWVFTFDAIREVWADFPAIIGDLAFQAGDVWLGGINAMLNKAIEAVRNFYLTFLNPVAGAAKALGYDELSKWTGGNLLDGFKANLDMGENPFAGRAAAAGGRVIDAGRDALSRDYMGQAFEALREQAVANTLARTAAEADKAGAAMKRAANDNADPWAKLREVTKGTGDDFGKVNEQAERFNAIILSAGNQFASAWRDGKLELEEILSIIENVAREIISLAGSSGGFGNLFRSIFGGAGYSPAASAAIAGAGGGFVGLYHTGGVAGMPGQSRFVPSGIFANAPRYHFGGLAGDEVPAILQRGERILPKGAGGTGMNVNVQVINQVDGARVETRHADDGVQIRVLPQILGAVAEDIAKGGVVGRSIQGVFGARRVTR